MNSKTLAYYIREFFVTYLTTRRNCSMNTVASYRDTIKLFLNYNITEKNINVEKLNIDVLNYENVNQFLDFLETARNVSINSRNQRLACIKSLCKYIISYEPTYLEQLSQIINIKAKKYHSKNIDFFTKEEITELLHKPNTNSKKGIKDLTVITILYDSAIRISELIELKTEDIVLDSIPKIIIRKAKGNKSREVPITNDTVKILQQYKNIFKPQGNDYFIKSNQKKKYTPNGIRRIIKKYTNDFHFKVTPHTFRHTKASHLVEANIPLIYIRDFLGHEHIETTEIYTKVNNKIKDSTIIENSIPLNTVIKYNMDNMDKDSELLEWLNSL